MKQATNIVKITGILSEKNIEYRNYTKNGEKKDAISAEIKIRTVQTINGEEKTLEIPVRFFSQKLLKNKTINPIYTNIENLNTFKSIAEVGEDEADRVRITSGQIRMNEFYPAGSNVLISRPMINASYINKVSKEVYKPMSSFELEFVVASKNYEVNNRGEETGRLIVNAIVPIYDNKVDVIPLISANENVSNSINDFWNEGDTVCASGKLNFSSKTETVYTEVDFGEPEESVRTTNIHELLITGGQQEPMPEDMAYNMEEIKVALAERKERLEEQKEKSHTRVTAPKSSSTKLSDGFDLGF